jgi:hypothetical protein
MSMAGGVDRNARGPAGMNSNGSERQSSAISRPRRDGRRASAAVPARRRLGCGAEAEIRNAAGDTSSSTELRVEIALGAQLLVRGHDGSTRYSKVGGETACRWKAGAWNNHAVDDVAAQAQVDAPMQRLGLKCGEVHFDDSATRRGSYSGHRTWTEGADLRRDTESYGAESSRVHKTHENRTVPYISNTSQVVLPA